MVFSKVLPDSVLRCMPKDERAKLGKAGVTAAEAQAKLDCQRERELQRHIANELRQRNIPFQQTRMDRKTTGTIGWPDFTFAYRGCFCAFECKSPGKRPNGDQARVIAELGAQGGKVIVVWEFQEALNFLRSFDETVIEVEDVGDNDVRAWIVTAWWKGSAVTKSGCDLDRVKREAVEQVLAIHP